MSSSGTTLERLDDGIVLGQLDDLCLVRIDDRSFDASQTRKLSQKLLDFVERGNCRKLVISFEGVENIYGFLLDKFSYWATPSLSGQPQPPPQPASPGSDLWVG